jgi:hypothetical protein
MTLSQTWRYVRWLVFFGWIVAGIRYILEFVAPEQAWYFGVYFVMPLAYLYYGITGKMDDLSWKHLALAMIMVAFFVWFIPNAVAYTTGQFMGWQHGRFAADPIAASSPGKLGTGVRIAFITFIAGALWSILFSTLVTWLPGHVRRRKVQSAT